MTDEMQNPYLKADLKPHFLDRAVARVACFDIVNIMAASVALAGEYEMSEAEEDPEPNSNYKLHMQLAEPRLSQLLLQIAVFVRSFDDVMSATESSAAYAAHAAATDGENYIGILDGEGDFRLREACNKIIHATDFRPIYDRVERDMGNGDFRPAWHLTGEIELLGTQAKKEWNAVLHVQPFLEIVLDRIAFEPDA